MNNFSDVVRLGKDAVTRFTAAGKSVTGFSAAVDSGFGDKKKTIWIDCSAWGERWEKVAPYLVKGTQVMINGELGTREHEGKTYITVDVKELKLVGGKPGDQQRETKSQEHSAPRHSAPVPAGDLQDDFADDEIPF